METMRLFSIKLCKYCSKKLEGMDEVSLTNLCLNCREVSVRISRMPIDILQKILNNTRGHEQWKP